MGFSSWQKIPLLILAALSGCSQHTDFASIKSAAPPEFVYVRTPDVKVSVEILAKSEAAVGEWITLSASRDVSGAWKRTKFAELGADTPWLGAPLAGHEAEVAGNLHWFTDPPTSREFDVPGQTSSATFDKRMVRFKAPGSYRVWATSYSPIDATSNTIVVTVR